MMHNSEIDYSQYLSKKRPCIICQSNNFSTWCTSGDFKVLQCKKCQLVFVNPCLNNEGLKIVYEGHHKDRIRNDEEINKRKIQYTIDKDYLEDSINKGSILDVGCGGGFFLSNFNQKKWKCFGLEIDPDTAPYAKKNFNIDVHIGTSEKIPFKDLQFDVVCFRGSFEHLVNPEKTMLEVNRVLKPGGYLYICALPNVDSYCAKLYKDKWNQFDAKEHIFMFSLSSLKKLVAQFGFIEKKHSYFYQETPYSNIIKDIQKVADDQNLIQQGKINEVDVSPPFWENMLSVLFSKKNIN